MEPVAPVFIVGRVSLGGEFEPLGVDVGPKDIPLFLTASNWHDAERLRLYRAKRDGVPPDALRVVRFIAQP